MERIIWYKIVAWLAKLIVCDALIICISYHTQLQATFIDRAFLNHVPIQLCHNMRCCSILRTVSHFSRPCDMKRPDVNTCSDVYTTAINHRPSLHEAFFHLLFYWFLRTERDDRFRMGIVTMFMNKENDQYACRKNI